MNLLMYNRRPAANFVIPGYSVEWHAAGLNPLDISRRCMKRPGICSWMSVWHSIYSPVQRNLLRVFGWSFHCDQKLIRCDSSKRIKEVAEVHSFRGIIAGTMQDNAWYTHTALCLEPNVLTIF